MFKTHCLSFVIKGIFTLCNTCLRLEEITSPHSQTEIFKVFRGATKQEEFYSQCCWFFFFACSVLKEGW